MEYRRIFLKRGKEESLKRFHPWVFSGAIASMDDCIDEGDLVTVYTSDGKLVGNGHYEAGSIAVRLLSFGDEEINFEFFYMKLKNALQMRLALNLLRADNNAFRLVHGEGDLLPGLIVDVYGDTAIIQAHTPGMHSAREVIASALVKLPGDVIKNVFYKSEGTLSFKTGIETHNEYLIGKSDVDVAIENGLQFHVDWLKGQKTGFFVDQRDNRSLVEKYSRGRSVLNMFCYTGGFSCYAMRGGAQLVHSVDSSAKAISLTNDNVKLNFGDDVRHTAWAEDAFKFIDNIDAGTYDLIILDPPAFAKHRSAVNKALVGYRKLNAKAMRKIQAGGLLFTFSCSQAVNRDQFRLAVLSAAVSTGRSVKILHQLTQPADHPISIYHPEGEYLKGLVLYVE